MEENAQSFPLGVPSFDLRNFSGNGNVDVGNMFNPSNANQQGNHQQPRQSQQLASGDQQQQPQDSRNPPFFGQFGGPTSGGPGVDDFQLLLNIGPNTQNTHPPLTITAEQLREQLAQQLRLQQLQQLQNRILQEQIQLLTGTTLGSRPDIQQLLTPTNTDIRSPSQSTQVSPGMLPPGMFMPSHGIGITPNASHYHPGMGSMSAPPSIAFNHQRADSPTFLTPLTSPVFPPISNSNNQQQLTRNKLSSDALQEMDNGVIRSKRVPHSFRPNTISPRVLGQTTPRPNLDTPSPVDLSMPPPAAPLPPSHLQQRQQQQKFSPPLITPNQSTNVSPDLPTATPGRLMDMDPNFALPPPGLHPNATPNENAINGVGKKKTGKAATTRPRATSAATATVANSRVRRSTAGRGAASSAYVSSHPYSSTATTSTTLPPRKNTHKDAEQRRRDSLKRSFDELRTLLPPIPLSAGSDPDDPPLPGAMPPRGPPKGDGDGPNRAVSKLALLRCGNEFILDLRGRVERRDEEIGRLRNEVHRLRVMMEGLGIDPTSEETGVDLERDLIGEDEHFREERRRVRKIQRIVEEGED